MKTLKLFLPMVLIFMMIVVVGSCGKKDKGGAQPNVVVTPVTPPPAPAPAPVPTPPPPPVSVDVNERRVIADYSQFTTEVNAGRFLARPYKNTYFQMNEFEIDINKIWFFKTSTLKTISTFFRSELENGQIDHANGFRDSSIETTRAEIVTKLKNIVANANMYSYQGGAFFLIQTKDGDMYGIDLNAPIVANPIYFVDHESQEGYSFVRYTTYYW